MFLILALGSLAFWSLYQMAHNGVQLFAVNNVDLHLWGIRIAPQWVLNINTVVIVFGGPLLAALFSHLRRKGWNIDIPLQFSVSLLLMGLGFLALPLGISQANAIGRSAFAWLLGSYVLQSIGELLISHARRATSTPAGSPRRRPPVRPPTRRSTGMTISTRGITPA